MICAELYRYVRDYAYDYLQHPEDATRQDTDKNLTLRYLKYATDIEQVTPPLLTNIHYTQLRDIAYSHLHDARLVSSAKESVPNHVLRKIREFLHRR